MRDRNPVEACFGRAIGMGMTLPEYLLFACGATCLVHFFIRTAIPSCRTRLDDAAEETAKRLREDFLSLSPQQVHRTMLGAGFVSAIATFSVTHDLFLATVAGAVPSCLCGAAARLVRARRRNRIVSQLAAFLDVLSGHVKAGHSVAESLQEAIPVLPSGIREEVSWICQTTRLGTSLPDALLLWEGRMGCEEVSMIVRPLRTAIPVGGNLHVLLTRCRDVLRMKTRQAEKMRSMTAQARVQALILTFLPVGFIAILSNIEPSYLSRCLDTAAGKTILSVAGTLQLLGWACIRRIMAGNR